MITMTLYKSVRNFLPVFISFFLLLILMMITSCAEVAVTHRRGMHLVSNAQLNTTSFQEYDRVLKESKLSTDKGRIDMVKRVGNRIAKAAEASLEDTGQGQKIKDYKWEFNVIEDEKTANAWCMPGGKVAVYTGILPYTLNETGLAVVMGHEVAHALADHGNERMSQELLTQLGGMALSTALNQTARTSGNASSS